jgi:DNA-binding protein HU-beta
MTKTELIAEIANQTNLSKADATRAVDAFLTSITKTLQDSGKVTLTGFGTFTVTERAARKGRNPQTGEEIMIEAAKSVRFKPGKALKDAV